MINFLFRFRYLWLLLTLAACFFLTPGVQRAVQVDNSLTVWFLKDDPALLAYQDFQQKFGNDEVVILVVRDEQTLLQPEYFRKFTEMTTALEKLPEVEQVIGPGNATVVQSDVLGPYTKPLLTIESSPEQVRLSLTEMPVLREQLFTSDFKTSRFLIVLKLLPDFDERRGEILRKVKSEVHRYFPEKQSYFGGVGIIYAGLNALSEHDFAFFAGLGYVVMFLLILLIYRNVLVLLYALGTVGLATYTTLGIYGALGFQLNLMTVLLPAIFILLGIMDVMHIINEKKQITAEGSPAKETALLALKQVFRPCLFTSLTTMAGFLALVSSPMAILQTFGIFAAVGIFLSFIFTYLLGFLLLPSIKLHQASKRFSGPHLINLLHLVLRKKAVFGAISVALLILGIAGIFMLRSDTYTLGYFPENHEVVQDHQAMQKAWGAYMPLELLVQPEAGTSLHAPEILKAAITFADSVKTISGVGKVFGFHSLYQAGLQAQFKEKSTRMLESRSVLNQADKQLKQLYPELAHQFMHEPSQTGRITIFGGMASAKELTAMTDSLMGISKAVFGKTAIVTPSGYQPMYANIVQYVTDSQVNSLLLALVLVFLLIWLFLRNLKLALLSVLPNLFPIIIMLGVMGWAGINLDTATASIAAIVLSFCLDDTIHYSYHYNHCRRAGIAPALARIKTTEHVGTAIVLTSVVLFCGYFLMIFGSMKTVALFGLLTAIAIASALFSQLVIFPMLLERFDREKLQK